MSGYYIAIGTTLLKIYLHIIIRKYVYVLFLIHKKSQRGIHSTFF